MEKESEKKFSSFLNNTKEINNLFEIIPLLYGSLGLEVLTGIDFNPDDIDILIPYEYVKGSKWNDFRKYLESLDYKLIDEHEHTFLKDNIKYSYAFIEDLTPFAGIQLDSIKVYEKEGIKYKLLSLEQYLKVYEKSSLDGYRANKKEHKDNKKIVLIKKLMER